MRDVFNPFVVSHSRRSRSLDLKFVEFNREYFDGSLPRYQVLLCRKSRPFGHEIAGYCLAFQKRIVIRDGLGSKSTLQTLLHEMVHAKFTEITKGSREVEVHGREFIEVLHALRKRGAPLSPLDVDRTRNKPLRLTEQSVRKLITIARFRENLGSKDVPGFLQLELMLPISFIRQKMEIKTLIMSVYKIRKHSLDQH